MSETHSSWLVTGGSGLLGNALCAYLLARGNRVVAVRREHPMPTGADEIVADLAAGFDADRLLVEARATHVVHAAAMTDVDRCETREPAARRLHIDATETLARAARARGARFVLISTDQLWGGLHRRAAEDDIPAPVNAYGRTKAAGERIALATHPQALVVRTNFFGAGTSWRRSAADRVIDAISAGGTYQGFSDVWFTPIGLPVLCRLLFGLVAHDAGGILHVAGGERVSKLEFARAVATHIGFPAERVESASVSAAMLTAPRPRELALDSTRAERLVTERMPSIAESLAAVYGPARNAPGRHSTKARIRE